MSTENHRGLQKDTTCYARARSSSTTNRYIHRGNCYAESIHSTKPPGGEGDTPDTKSHTRNESPPKRYCTQAYKPGDPPPTGCREGTRNTGATTTTSKEPALCQKSTAKVIEDRGPPIQVEIDYMHYKMGRQRIKAALEKGCKSIKRNYIKHPIGKGNFPPI